MERPVSFILSPDGQAILARHGAAGPAPQPPREDAEANDATPIRPRDPDGAPRRGARGRPDPRAGLAGPHPLDDDEHPGLGAPRRAGPDVRAGDRLLCQDDLGGHGPGARPRRARRGGRHARPRAGPREEVRGGGQDAEPAPRHVQRLRRDRPRRGPGEDQGTVRGRGPAGHRRRGGPLRVAGRQVRHPPARAGPLEAGRDRAEGVLVPRVRARGWGRRLASPTTAAPTR